MCRLWSTSGTNIQGRVARQTALLTLTRDVPKGVLADLLGIDDATAEQWRILVGAQWVDMRGWPPP